MYNSLKSKFSVLSYEDATRAVATFFRKSGIHIWRFLGRSQHSIIEELSQNMGTNLEDYS